MQTYTGIIISVPTTSDNLRREEAEMSAISDKHDDLVRGGFCLGAAETQELVLRQPQRPAQRLQVVVD